MIWAGLILGMTLFVFAIGKSPFFRLDRAGAAIVGAALTIGLGILSFDEAVGAVDHRTIVILFSMMIILANFKLAGFFDIIGSYILKTVSTRRQLLLAIVVMTGLLSAFCINDIVCLLFTPIVLFICRKANCPAVPHLLAIAMAANIGSAATLIGNPQNIMIASLSGLSFMDYFYTAFPIALMGLIFTYLIINWFYYQDLDGILSVVEHSPIVHHQYLITKGLVVLVMVIGGFIGGWDLALTASLGAACLLITRRIKPNKMYTSVDFNLLVIFIGLFVVVGGVEKVGLMSRTINFLSFIDFQNFSVFTAATVLLSNIFSNVPAVLLLKYFLPEQDANLWWKALALFTTFAGNLTITGSIANLIVVEIAQKDNVHVGFMDYFKVGFPLTLLIIVLGLIVLSGMY